MKGSHKKEWPIVWFHIYEMCRRGKSIETDSRLVVARAGGGGKEHGEWLLISMGLWGFVFFWSDDNIVKWDYDDSCITLWIY